MQTTSSFDIALIIIERISYSEYKLAVCCTRLDE
ncbi:hypothetical protein J512_4319, partial [Acinetobacter baumannii 1295743]